MAVSHSKTITGIIVTILISSSLWVFLADGINKYDPEVPSDYNDSFTRIQANLDIISANTENASGQLGVTVNPETDTNDFLGFIFNSGYQSAQTAVASLEVTYDIIDISIDGLLGSSSLGSLYKTGLTLMVLIFITVTILLGFIIKSGRE